MAYILGIETSCDETAASVTENGRKVLSNVVYSQIPLHTIYGGVVPEIASRRHCENISTVVAEALKESNCTLSDIDAIAVTYAPGLIGALLVGISYAKGLALSTGKPLIAVHHIAGHIAANYISHPEIKLPYLCLVVSGGHSHIVEVRDYTKYHVIGRTRDDAAGECFDKVARTLGYEYPGGKYIDSASKLGNSDAFKLPKPKVQGSEFDFSFSGLKTAVINTVHNAAQKGEIINREDMAASFQKTISEILVEKTMKAAEEYGYTTIGLAGGVSANSGVRNALQEACDKRGYKLFMPEFRYCGDNAAMIGCQAYFDYIAGKRAGQDLNGIATLSLDKLSE